MGHIEPMTMKRTFTVRAVWDAEAGVFYSESDISGLHIEAATIEEFESLLKELGPQLIMANHIKPGEHSSMPIEDLVPTILWQRPTDAVPA